MRQCYDYKVVRLATRDRPTLNLLSVGRNQVGPLCQPLGLFVNFNIHERLAAAFNVE